MNALGTTRADYTNEYYKHVCSEIIEDFIYLGGDKVAQNKELLKKNGITHVMNCAADYSDNYHKNDFVYKSYHLGDNTRENIECVFYDGIDFFDKVKREGGRVYVHCVQGISRSCTMIMCYLMKTNGDKFEDLFDFMRGKRAVINPNFAFITQLCLFHKRLYNREFDSVPVNPRCFAVLSHSDNDARWIVSKMIMENLYNGPNQKPLDPRGVFIVQGAEKIYIWVGADVFEANIKAYKDQALFYIERL